MVHYRIKRCGARVPEGRRGVVEAAAGLSSPLIRLKEQLIARSGHIGSNSRPMRSVTRQSVSRR